MPSKGSINLSIRDSEGNIIPWKKRNPTLANKAARLRRRKALLENPEKEKRQRRKWFVKHKFGLSLELREALIKLQDNTCSICNKFMETNSTEWATDHEHTDNYVRGMLCKTCNSGLGLFKDNPDVLMRAAEYIIQTRTILNEPSTEDFKGATDLLESIKNG